MPSFMMEPRKAREGLTEESAERTSRNFSIELSTDEKARHNLDFWEPLVFFKELG